MKADSVNINFDNIPHNLTDLFSSYGHCKAILNIQIDHYATKST